MASITEGIGQILIQEIAEGSEAAHTEARSDGGTEELLGELLGLLLAGRKIFQRKELSVPPFLRASV
jgi:hypothetical protein